MRHWAWLAAFLRNCTEARYNRNSERLLVLAKISMSAHAALLERHGLDFDARQTGKLWLAPTDAALQSAIRHLPLRRHAGFEVEALNVGECLKVAPQLGQSKYAFAGGIYAPESPVGDCRAFTSNLIKEMQAQGVKVDFGVKASNVETSGGRVTGVKTKNGAIPAEVVVLASGLSAPELLPRRHRPSIAPLRGVSVTLPCNPTALDVSITDSKRAVAICRLGHRLRVTGGAEFAPSGAPSRRAVRRIMDVARAWMPEAADYDTVENQAWCGVRPTTVDSLPCISQAGAEGLYINAGHGSLGWTLAAGSAEILRRQIMNADGAGRAAFDTGPNP